MSIQKLVTLNLLFSPGKPNNTHSSRWSKLKISNSLIFVDHLNQYFQNLFALSHFRRVFILLTLTMWFYAISLSTLPYNFGQIIVLFHMLHNLHSNPS